MKLPINEIIAICWKNKIIANSEKIGKAFKLNVTINGKKETFDEIVTGLEVSNYLDKIYRFYYDKLKNKT